MIEDYIAKLTTLADACADASRKYEWGTEGANKLLDASAFIRWQIPAPIEEAQLQDNMHSGKLVLVWLHAAQSRPIAARSWHPDIWVDEEGEMVKPAYFLLGPDLEAEL